MTLKNYLIIYKMENTGRFTYRALEIIYDNTSQNSEYYLEYLQGLKYGVYAGFGVTHVKNDQSHCHLGIILRDRPNILWKNLTAFFSIPGVSTTVRRLKSTARKMETKLQMYFDYCTDQTKHPNEEIQEPSLHKFKPKDAIKNSEGEKVTPHEFISDKIFAGWTINDIDDFIVDKVSPRKVRIRALKDYDIYCKMINTYQDILDKRTNEAAYKKTADTYRPFQKQLCEILDDQNDREIHNHFDEGNTGKNYFISNEAKRPDTLILQSAETKRIAAAWDPKIHKRIIFDVPKHKAEFLNTSVIEKLKNGTVFSTMHRPKTKLSTFKPSILILSNEPIKNDWTEDRLQFSTTNVELPGMFELENAFTEFRDDDASRGLN